jgi:hypothetical protein
MRAGQLTPRHRGAPIALAVFALLLAGRHASAEPYLAVRAGAKCSDCHTNMSGGGKRTPYSAMHSHDILRDLDILPLPARVRPFSGELTEHISIGGDFRVRNTYAFEDHADHGRVSNDRFTRDRLDSINFDVEEGLGYLEVNLWPDIATFYVDEQFAPGGATNREVFGLLQNLLPWGVYFKGGQFFPVYGLRIWDDTSFIRSRTGFTFDNPDTGVEIGMTPGPFYLAAGVTDGIKGNRDVVVTVNGYTLLEDIPVLGNVLAGGSYARLTNKLNEWSVYGGANLWRFTYLGEVDFITNNTPGSNPRNQLAAYAEVNFLAFDWLNIRGAFDFVQVGNDNDQNRFSIGLEPFINRFLQPRLVYRAGNGPPTDLPANRAQLILEMHIFF